jgi:flagellar basal body-associated protein FliL
MSQEQDPDDFNLKPLDNASFAKPEQPEQPPLLDDISEAEVEDAYQTPELQSGSRINNRSGKTIPLIILAVIIAIGLIGVIVFSGSQDPKPDSSLTVVDLENDGTTGETGPTDPAENNNSNKQNKQNKNSNKQKQNKKPLPQVIPVTEKQLEALRQQKEQAKKEAESARDNLMTPNGNAGGTFTGKKTVQVTRASEVVMAKKYNPSFKNKPKKLAAFVQKATNYPTTATNAKNPRNVVEMVVAPELGMVVLIHYNNNGFPSIKRVYPWASQIKAR